MKKIYVVMGFNPFNQVMDFNYNSKFSDYGYKPYCFNPFNQVMDFNQVYKRIYVFKENCKGFNPFNQVMDFNLVLSFADITKKLIKF